MRNNPRTKVNIMKFASILFISLSILLVMFFTFEGKIREFVYNVNPNTVNLVRVSIYAVEHHDLRMIKKYLPLAIDSPDFEEVVNENKFFTSKYVRYKEYARSSHFTNYVFVLELSFTYLKEDDNDNFSDISTRLFVELVSDAIAAETRLYYYDSLERYKLSIENCETLLREIEGFAPKPEKIEIEFDDTIMVYLRSLYFKQLTYDYLGDVERAQQYNNEIIRLAEEYNKVKEGK